MNKFIQIKIIMPVVLTSLFAVADEPGVHSKKVNVHEIIDCQISNDFKVLQPLFNSKESRILKNNKTLLAVEPCSKEVLKTKEVVYEVPLNGLSCKESEKSRNLNRAIIRTDSKLTSIRFPNQIEENRKEYPFTELTYKSMEDGGDCLESQMASIKLVDGKYIGEVQSDYILCAKLAYNTPGAKLNKISSDPLLKTMAKKAFDDRNEELKTAGKVLNLKKMGAEFDVERVTDSCYGFDYDKLVKQNKSPGQVRRGEYPSGTK